MDQFDITSEQYTKAIQIWLKNSHVVNRRLSGVLQILNCKLRYSVDCFQALLRECKSSEIEILKSCSKELIQDHIFSNSRELVNVLSDDDFENELCISDNHNEDDKQIFICIQKLLPRSPKFKETYRICLLNNCDKRAIFINKSQNCDLIDLAPVIPYCIALKEGNIIIEGLSADDEESKFQWLKEKLLPRIIKWALSDAGNTNGITGGSLNLIPLDKYNTKYQELKTKYGQEMVKIWPENTDPAKFVFEDVAIATYLLLLWEEERKVSGSQKLQSFIDLGCGNGLLVYILSSEGHPGKGVDVRKRGIWDLYPDFVQLQVEPVTPSANFLYKDTDWLIGNHSDELTPWIPVLAARSSYNCRFFLLPCCAYEFDGKKYQRIDSSKSQYNEYLEYIKLICDKCGIKTEIDRLKIPSTKRICLVGTKRLYTNDDQVNRVTEIQNFINERCVGNNNRTELPQENDLNCQQAEQWVTNFIPREGIEKVRNCTKIEKCIINEIIASITTDLLKEKNYSNKKWNSGGCIPMSTIVKCVPVDKLKMLKKECGGLQTLLRNNHHIFEVVSGNVKLRHPRSKTEVLKQMSKTNKEKKKQQHTIVLNQKPCWFYNNHPDGCPLPSGVCSFVHSA